VNVARQEKEVVKKFISEHDSEMSVRSIKIKDKSNAELKGIIGQV
jgi:hypothetical protein